MPLQAPITGSEYRFTNDGFTCKDYPDPIRYEDIISAAVVPGSRWFDITFRTPKGKKRKVSVLLERAGEEDAVCALLMERLTGAAYTRPQTVRECCGGWGTFAVCLCVLIGLIIMMNTVGRGSSVSVPIWFIPFLMIGSILSVGQLVGIAGVIVVVCAVGALVSLKRRKTVWIIEA